MQFRFFCRICTLSPVTCAVGHPDAFRQGRNI
jgi:hypothetical protein